MDYAAAIQKKAEMVAQVRDSGLLRAEVDDEQIWAHWRELSRQRPTSAFDCTRSLNILAICDQLARAGCPESALAPIREYAATLDFPEQDTREGGG